MNYAFCRLGAVAALALTLSACGQGGGAAVDMDTPEYGAMVYRQSLMRLVANKAGTLRGMADGNMPVDEAVFAKSASDLVVLASMVGDTTFTTPGSDSESLPGSNALPVIWDDLDAFGERAAALREATQTVASLAQAGGFQAAQAAASEQIGPACGGCHRMYRQSDN